MTTQETSPEPDKDSHQLLIEEYNVIENYAYSVDQRVFQLAAILIAASLGTFALIAGQRPISPFTIVLSCFGGCFFISLNYHLVLGNGAFRCFYICFILQSS